MNLLDGIKHWPELGSIHASVPDGPIPKGRGGRNNNKSRSTSSARKRTPHFQAIGVRKKKSFLWLAGPSITESLLFATNAAYCTRTPPRLQVSTYSELYSTVCLPIKYGYKAAEASAHLPSSYHPQKEQTERRQSGTGEERERGRGSTGAGKGEREEAPISRLCSSCCQGS